MSEARENRLSKRRNTGRRRCAQPDAQRLLPLLDDDVRTRFAKMVGGPGPNGCREWIGSRSKSGYPRFHLAGTKQAHRVAWVMAHNEELPEAAVIHHECGNRACVAPEHLTVHTSHAGHVASEHGGGPPTDDQYRARATAHLNGQPIAPLGLDGQVKYLGWLWQAANESRGWLAVRITDHRSAEARGLRRLLESSNEQTATLALIQMVYWWDQPPPQTRQSFRQWAVANYGLWGSWLERAPLRPIPLRADTVMAALGWQDHCAGLQRKAAERRELAEREEREAREYEESLARADAAWLDRESSMTDAEREQRQRLIEEELKERKYEDWLARKEHEDEIREWERQTRERSLEDRDRYRARFAAEFPDEWHEIVLLLLRGNAEESERRLADATNRGRRLLIIDEESEADRAYRTGRTFITFDKGSGSDRSRNSKPGFRSPDVAPALGYWTREEGRDQLALERYAAEYPDAWDQIEPVLRRRLAGAEELRAFAVADGSDLLVQDEMYAYEEEQAIRDLGNSVE